jgi:serine/threonine protein kinase
LEKDKTFVEKCFPLFKAEIKLLESISHENLVNIKEILVSSAYFVVVYEFVSGGGLLDKIVDRGRFSESESHFYFLQLLSGIQHCHDNGICHGKLTAEVTLTNKFKNLYENNHRIRIPYQKLGFITG